MNFIFSWLKQYFTHSLRSLVKYCFATWKYNSNLRATVWYPLHHDGANSGLIRNSFKLDNARHFRVCCEILFSCINTRYRCWLRLWLSCFVRMHRPHLRIITIPSLSELSARKESYHSTGDHLQRMLADRCN